MNSNEKAGSGNFSFFLSACVCATPALFYFVLSMSFFLLDLHLFCISERWMSLCERVREKKISEIMMTIVIFIRVKSGKEITNLQAMHIHELNWELCIDLRFVFTTLSVWTMVWTEKFFFTELYIGSLSQHKPNSSLQTLISIGINAISTYLLFRNIHHSYWVFCCIFSCCYYFFSLNHIFSFGSVV